MKKNENGFSAIELLIVFVIVGLIMAVGWLVWDKQNVNDNQTTTSQGSSEQAAQLANNTKTEEIRISSDWLIRKSNKVSISVPDGFKILSSSGEDFDFVLPDQPQGTLEYKKGTLARVVGAPAKHFELGLIVGFNSEGFNDRGTKLREFKTYNGLNIEVKLFEQTTDPDGVDFPKGAKHLKYKVIKGSDYINIDYVYLGDGIVDIIDQMVRTADIF